jgi:hypothetical protein
MAKVSAHIEAQKHLHPAQRKAYSEAMERVFRAMPHEAIVATLGNVKQINFHNDAEAVTNAYRARGNTVPKGYQIQGYYSRREKSLTLDGYTAQTDTNPELGDAHKTNIHGTYAHELMHAIDGNDFQHSGTEEWKAAWTEEVVAAGRGIRLSGYARTSTAEGFAEFGRLVYGSDAPRELIEKRFPKCVAFFKRAKLWQ